MHLYKALERKQEMLAGKHGKTKKGFKHKDESQHTQPPPVTQMLVPTFEWWRLIHIWINSFWFEDSILSYNPLWRERASH